MSNNSQSTQIPKAPFEKDDGQIRMEKAKLLSKQYSKEDWLKLCSHIGFMEILLDSPKIAEEIAPKILKALKQNKR